MPATEWTFDDCIDLLRSRPAGRPCCYWVKDKVPVPNPAKVHDVPILGKVTNFSQDVVVNAFQSTVKPYFENFIFDASDEQADQLIRKEFRDADTNSDGILSETQVGNLLRKR